MSWTRKLGMVAALGVAALVAAYAGSWLAVRKGCTVALDREGSTLREVVDVGEVCTCAATGTLVRVKNPLALVEAAWWAWRESEAAQPGLSVFRALSPSHTDDVATMVRVLDAHRACLPPAAELLPKLRQQASEAREAVTPAPKEGPAVDAKTGRLRRGE